MTDPNSTDTPEQAKRRAEGLCQECAEPARSQGAGTCHIHWIKLLQAWALRLKAEVRHGEEDAAQVEARLETELKASQAEVARLKACAHWGPGGDDRAGHGMCLYEETCGG